MQINLMWTFWHNFKLKWYVAWYNSLHFMCNLIAIFFGKHVKKVSFIFPRLSHNFLTFKLLFFEPHILLQSLMIFLLQMLTGLPSLSVILHAFSSILQFFHQLYRLLYLLKYLQLFSVGILTCIALHPFFLFLFWILGLQKNCRHSTEFLGTHYPVFP